MYSYRIIYSFYYCPFRLTLVVHCGAPVRLMRGGMAIHMIWWIWWYNCDRPVTSVLWLLGGAARMRACCWCFELCEDGGVQCMLFWRYLSTLLYSVLLHCDKDNLGGWVTSYVCHPTDKRVKPPQSCSCPLMTVQQTITSVQRHRRKRRTTTSKQALVYKWKIPCSRKKLLHLC